MSRREECAGMYCRHVTMGALLLQVGTYSVQYMVWWLMSWTAVSTCSLVRRWEP